MECLGYGGRTHLEGGKGGTLGSVMYAWRIIWSFWTVHMLSTKLELSRAQKI